MTYRHALMVSVLTLCWQAPAGAQEGGKAIGKSFSKEAPASAIPPADPRDFSSVWTWRSYGARVAPVYKPGITPPPAPVPGQQTIPDPGQLCVPLRFFGSGTYPTQIVQTPGQVTIIQEENHRIRRVYLDRAMPASFKPTYGGFSVGHWEGDTLVIETRYLRPSIREPIPADQRVVERLRRIADGRELEWKVTTSSASTLVSPREETIILNWRPDLHIQEQVCEENSEAFGDAYWNLKAKP